MTDLNRGQDLLTIVNKMDKRLRGVERTSKYDDENDLPPQPPTVVMNFGIREYKTHPEYNGIVTWALATINTCQADVDRWVVQIRATDDSGNPIHRHPGGPDVKHEAHVDNKGDTDPHAFFVHLPRPKLWYWQARVAIRDKAHRLGPFSAWTTAQLPVDEAGPKPPVPSGITLTFDTIEKTRWDRVRAIVTWNEIGNWDIPGSQVVNVTNATAAASIATFTINVSLNVVVGSTIEVKGVTPAAYNGEWKVITVSGPGTTITANIGATPGALSVAGTMTDVKDKESDVAAYQVQLRACNAAGTVGLGPVRKAHVTARDLDADTTQQVAFPKHIKKTAYYQTRIRSIDRFHRKGDFSAWLPSTPGQSTDNTAPPVPASVVIVGKFQEIGIKWDEPTDADDSEIVNDDVAHFQVQLSTTANFSVITEFDKMTHNRKKFYDSTKYKQRFWLRVRSVDSSQNKSAWVSGGPVSPQKATGTRQVVAGTPGRAAITMQNEIGANLIGGLSNRGKLVSTTNDAFAWIDGENKDGSLFCTLSTSPTTDRSKSGIIFRRVDNNNLLIFNLRDVASGNGIYLQKRDGGTYSTLTSNTSIEVLNGQSYSIEARLSGNSITIYIDGVSRLTYTLAGGDSTKYNAAGATGVGIYADAGAAIDDGKSRWSEFEWITLSDGVTVAYDDFDRAASGSSVGNAESGQTWTAAVGTWGIEASDQPVALLAGSATMPILFGGRDGPDTGVSIPKLADPAVMIGQGGPDLNNPGAYEGAIVFDVDQPTKLFALAVVNIENESVTVDANFRLYVTVEDNATQNKGRQVNVFSPQGDSGGTGKQRVLTNLRQYFVNASPSDIHRIQLWWGFHQDSAAARNVTLRNMKMLCILSYNPDIDPADAGDGTTTSTTKMPLWTVQKQTRLAYRILEGN